MFYVFWVAVLFAPPELLLLCSVLWVAVAAVFFPFKLTRNWGKQ